MSYSQEKMVLFGIPDAVSNTLNRLAKCNVCHDVQHGQRLHLGEKFLEGLKTSNFIKRSVTA
jgi:hypothetical protein